jgi:diadenosine tetraphosphatase ApaH/serine/threonine PP2A family protein phosphatase
MEVGEMPESDRPVEAARRESVPPDEAGDTCEPSGDGPEKAGVPPGSRGDEDDYEGDAAAGRPS